MIDVVVNYDASQGNFQIYESSTQTLLISDTLGDGFRNLNKFLEDSGLTTKNILEDDGILYHFDSHTFQEIIKSNMKLLKRVQETPSEFKNSANKFGKSSLNSSPSSGNQTPNFARGSKNFQKGKFSKMKESGFGSSFKRFGKNNFSDGR